MICKHCIYRRYDRDTGVLYCAITCENVSPGRMSCPDFEEKDWE